MPQPEMLLSPATAPLRTLTLHRIQLDGATPSLTFETHEEECVLYVLVGLIDVSVEGRAYGTFGGRLSIREEATAVLRLPAAPVLTVTVTLRGFAADVLLASAAVLTQHADDDRRMPYVHNHDTVWHTVGEDTHARRVGEVPLPPGYTIQCGETHNIPGGWSSWPAHCPDMNEALARCYEHEEVFMVITPGYALMHMRGFYSDGSAAANTVRRFDNGEAAAVPLGAHEIVAAPGAWLWYAWFYVSYLEKRYNRWATDGVKTYVR